MLLRRGDIAYLGLMLALNQIFVMLSSFIETNTVLFFAAAALIVGAAVVEFGGKSGAAFCAASILLGFVLSFNKVEMVTYALFFGPYSLIKYFIEKKAMRPIVEMILKLTAFNIMLAAMYFVLKGFIAIPLKLWMVVAAEVLFFVYDYAFSVFINFYMDRVRPRIKRN